MKMHFKLASLAAILLATTPVLADTTNGPDPYAASFGFDTPTEASWGGWNRGDANTLYAEWDTFTDGSYPGVRTAATDVGSHGTTAYIDWNSGTFTAGSGNLYSFSVTEVFNANLTGGSLSGPVRAVLQTEVWGIDIDPASVTLNGVVPTFSALTYHDDDYPSSFGPVALDQRVYYWDITSAPSNYVFHFESDEPSLSLAQVAIDVSPVPEPGEWAMLISGLGLLFVTVSRRRNQG